VLLQAVAEPAQKFGEVKNLGGQMFDFKRITPFCLEKRHSKGKMTILSKNFGGGMAPLAPPWLRLWLQVAQTSSHWIFELWTRTWKSNGVCGNVHSSQNSASRVVQTSRRNA